MQPKTQRAHIVDTKQTRNSTSGRSIFRFLLLLASRHSKQPVQRTRRVNSHDFLRNMTSPAKLKKKLLIYAQIQLHTTAVERYRAHGQQRFKTEASKQARAAAVVIDDDWVYSSIYIQSAEKKKRYTGSRAHHTMPWGSNRALSVL